MIPEKRPWRTPELVVLVRSGPEETVLTVCKALAALGPHTANSECVTVACGAECNGFGSS